MLASTHNTQYSDPQEFYRRFLNEKLSPEDELAVHHLVFPCRSRKVSNGNLLAILNRHYQDLTCLAFTDDSSHFLSGAKDCLVIVWSLYRWNMARALSPATCGHGTAFPSQISAVVLALWEISSGNLLLSVVFDVSIMSVTLDLAEYHMFCGGLDGSIFQVDLCSWPVQRERGFQSEQENGKIFKGHRNQVTCPITNAFLTLAPANMLNPDSKPRIPLPKFSRHLHSTESMENSASEGLTLCLGLHQKGSGESYLERTERLYLQMCSTREKNLMGNQEQLKIQVTELEEEVNTLRKINKSLFDFSSSIITSAK
ncbi:WD repeat-containing protein 18 [Ophiophagus hannah]|uniref:WD repeat-containing protein 18 n=1 Tax=Ophiophagus hannah TaxID=8665 RepID=V8NEB4_OPHHA|nr:WD repeat-containing protein 18 [Ophiophagus hannah]